MIPAIPTLLAVAAPAASTASGAAVEHFPPLTVALFLTIFAVSVVLDLVQHKDHKPVTAWNAGLWSCFWVALSLGFAGWLKYYHGEDHPEWSSLFLTGYVLEKTLSVDNLMVFIAIFKYFRISSGLQHRILYFGILGAIVFRALFVGLGSGLLALAGPYAELLFGGFVLWAAYQMVRGGDDDEAEPDYDAMPLVRFFRRFYPVFPRLVGAKFFVGREEALAESRSSKGFVVPDGVKRWMTPAFVCLLVVEGSDVMFSVDSVPAVIAVTKEPLIVYTAMIFAVLGLRSLYFVVERLNEKLTRLESAVVAVLAFIGVKMFAGALAHWELKLPWWGDLSQNEQANYSLVVVLSLLALGVVASLVSPKPSDGKDEEAAPEVE